MILVAGPLADPKMLDILKLAGEPVQLSGRLVGGEKAGVLLDGWPQLVPGAGEVQAVRAEWTPELRRYAAVFDLQPVATDQGEVLGITRESRDEASGPWLAPLAAAIARYLIDLPPSSQLGVIRARLPQIAVWADARLRASHERHPKTGPDCMPQWELLAREEPYARFFSVEDLRLRHRLNAGGWSEEMVRTVFVSGDAVVALPWDPVRDRVLLIDQFRPAPAARGDAQPWLYETVAGRIDPGETPEEAAHREAAEETGVVFTQLFEAPANYPSPGAVAEMLYLFVAIADLPDGIAGLGGAAEEGEDIRSHLISRAQLMQMVDAGEIRNGPLLTLALWLDRHAEFIRGQLLA